MTKLSNIYVRESLLEKKKIGESPMTFYGPVWLIPSRWVKTFQTNPEGTAQWWGWSHHPFCKNQRWVNLGNDPSN